MLAGSLLPFCTKKPRAEFANPGSLLLNEAQSEAFPAGKSSSDKVLASQTSSPGTLSSESSGPPLRVLINSLKSVVAFAIYFNSFSEGLTKYAKSWYGAKFPSLTKAGTGTS